MIEPAAGGVTVANAVSKTTKRGKRNTSAGSGGGRRERGNGNRQQTFFRFAVPVPDNALPGFRTDLTHISHSLEATM